jgi:hypothetical protein
MAARQIGVQRIDLRQQRGNRVDRSGQIGHRRRIEAGQLHRAIFGEDQQRGARRDGLFHPGVSLAT